MRIDGQNVSVALPAGWEGEISNGLQLLSDGAVRPTVAHLANFPLPPGRGDFGSGAVELMQPGDALVVLFEYDRSSADRSLFKAAGPPRALTAADFNPETLHSPVPAMSGVQRFFNHRGRAFCLFVVVGSHLDRADVLPQINAVLSGIEIS
jgi:hypothetical protein